MTDTTTRRRAGFTAFPEAPTSEPGVVAVLVTKDTETGTLKTYVKEYEGHNPPDPEIVAALTQSVEIANL